ncbi:MAG TPA: hypothetical protein VEC06_11410 [Paucimonas sp.]|nr:hypothetical protein [Paucimonas sp.]
MSMLAWLGVLSNILVLLSLAAEAQEHAGRAGDASHRPPSALA